MTIWRVLIELWAGLFGLAIAWGLYTTWRDRRADSRSSLRLVRRFRKDEGS